MRANRAALLSWVNKSYSRMPKMVHFGEFMKTWSLRSNSVSRQVSFKRTKNGGKRQNWRKSNETFWAISKQCGHILFVFQQFEKTFGSDSALLCMHYVLHFEVAVIARLIMSTMSPFYKRATINIHNKNRHDNSSISNFYDVLVKMLL